MDLQQLDRRGDKGEGVKVKHWVAGWRLGVKVRKGSVVEGNK